MGKHIEEKNLLVDEAQQAGRRRKIWIIVTWVIGILVALAILFAILFFTVFKPKVPLLTINSVTLKEETFDFSKLKFLLNPNESLNLTLLIDLSVENPNNVGLKYGQSVAYLRYKDKEIGEVPIEEGEIRKKEKKSVNLSMTLMADKVLRDFDAYAHMSSLPLSTDVELTGEIQLLSKVKVTSYSTCNFNIDVVTQALSNMSCQHKTK